MRDAASEIRRKIAWWVRMSPFPDRALRSLVLWELEHGRRVDSTPVGEWILADAKLTDAELVNEIIMSAASQARERRLQRHSVVRFAPSPVGFELRAFFGEGDQHVDFAHFCVEARGRSRSDDLAVEKKADRVVAILRHVAREINKLADDLDAR